MPLLQQAVVQEALDRMMTDRTTLVIAHRLSTIQHADKIIVVAKGAVQEVGSHDELLTRCVACTLWQEVWTQ